MPGLNSPHVVDLVTVNRKQRECRLIVVEDAAWDVDPDLDLFNAKMRTYLDFALSGQLTKTYPQATGLPLVFQFDLYFEPSASAREMLHMVGESLRAHDVKLRLQIRPPVRV